MFYAVIVLFMVVIYLIVLTFMMAKTVMGLYDDVEVLKKANKDYRIRDINQFLEKYDEKR